jgi:hypothetical protein
VAADVHTADLGRSPRFVADMEAGTVRVSRYLGASAFAIATGG